MDDDDFLKLKHELEDRGYSGEIQWANTMKRCEYPLDFFGEYCWVVLCSGMKEQIARKIEEKVLGALEVGLHVSYVFGHRGKSAAIEWVWARRHRLFYDYLESSDKVEFLKGLPWVGDITKYHLAKNLGADVVKPDRHLVRIARKYGVDCFELCRRLSAATGLRLAAVDQVLWRAGNLGLA